MESRSWKVTVKRQNKLEGSHTPENYFTEENFLMNAIGSRWGVALLAFAAAISIGSLDSRAQYTQQQPGKNMPEEKGEKGDKGKGPQVNKAEEDAYKAMYDARTGSPQTQIQLGEDFIAKFPQSRYLSGVYSQLTSAYYAVGNEDKLFAAGDKAIELNPDNVDALSLLAMAIPRRVKASSPDAAQKLQKAETYGKHALEVIPTLPKPETVDDAAFDKAKNEKLSMAHSGLGLIAIDHGKYEDARTELNQAVQLATNPDPVDYYLLANADSQTSYYNDAVAAYEKCAASGPLMAQCKARIDSAKKDATTKLGR
jgi:tetratricopeptide (TPR) repeat protein